VLPGNVVFHYAADAEFRRLSGAAVEGVGVTPDVVVIPARETLRGGAYGDPRRDPLVRLALSRD
jgi:C-terminal processing protease CtpA/Prc